MVLGHYFTYFWGFRELRVQVLSWFGVEGTVGEMAAAASSCEDAPSSLAVREQLPPAAAR